MANRLKSFRQKKGLSQAALATAVGTSQQQIQRIEGGQAVRMEMALRLCEALGARLEQVFPEAKPVLQRAKRRSKTGNVALDIYQSPEDSHALAQAGVDIDPAQHQLVLCLRGGLELRYWVLGSEAERLKSAIRLRSEARASHARGETGDEAFCVFDSTNARVALNLRHLALVHMLWEVGVHPEPKECGHNVRVYLEGATQPLEFEVEGDGPPQDDELDVGELHGLFHDLEAGPDAEEFLEFDDVDGERAFFRAGSLAILEVPHWAITESDGSADDEEAADE